MPTYGSLFAGAGGLDLGFCRAGFRCLWQVECDPTANDVRRRHWPDVLHIRDMIGMSRRPRRWGHWLDHYERPDVIIGGFPCQDLSVAGKRAGLQGDRSGLWWQMLRIISGLRPRAVVWENVPGLLSSDDGRDFARVLFSLAERGYHGAWRVLDAQHFGVPQRRRRVFGVFFSGSAGARRAAAVLALTNRLSGHPAKGEAAGQDIAGPLGSGTVGRGWSDDLDRAGAFVAGQCHGGAVGAPGTLRRGNGSLTGGVPFVAFGGNRTSGPRPVAAGLNGRSTGRQDFETETFIVRTSQTGANGSNVSEGVSGSQGAGDQPPAVCVPIDMRQASRGETMTNNRPEGSSGGPPGTGIGEAGDHCPTLADSHTPAVFNWQAAGKQTSLGLSELPGSQGTGQVPAIAFQERRWPAGKSVEWQEDLAYALTSMQGGGHKDKNNVAHTLRAEGFDASEDGTGRGNQRCPAPGAVRRLMPVECERLMGWPDGWTEYGASGKRIADGPRYRLCGNGVVGTVAEWLAWRLLAVLEGGE